MFRTVRPAEEIKAGGKSYMFKFLSEGLSPKAKMIAALVLVVVVVGGAVVGYKLWDYKENNPKFCVGCHLMDEAFDKWAVSEHKDVNCHECHHLSFKEQNELLISLVLHNPQEVPDRHGKVIVPWNFCVKCHWEKNEKYPNAPNVSTSPGHAKHFFMQQIECSQCHGYKLHRFTAEPRFCVRCHPDKEEVHGMPGLACLGCHTDKTPDMMPNRDKCLTCHGSKEQREKIAAEPATLDVKHFTPTPEEIEKASKLAVFPDDGAMQFACSVCHKPHTKLKLVVIEDCLKCHEKQRSIGKHGTHLEMGMICTDCHKPHMWKVQKSTLKTKKCTHPDNFLS